MPPFIVKMRKITYSNHLNNACQLNNTILSSKHTVAYMAHSKQKWEFLFRLHHCMDLRSYGIQLVVANYEIQYFLVLSGKLNSYD